MAFFIHRFREISLLTVFVFIISAAYGLAQPPGGPPGGGPPGKKEPPNDECILKIDHSTLNFSAQEGGSNPASQSLAISGNSNCDNLIWDASTTSSWLNLSSTSGTIPSSTSISVSIVGLRSGTQNATIMILSSGASNSPLNVAVTLTISSPNEPPPPPPSGQIRASFSFSPQNPKTDDVIRFSDQSSPQDDIIQWQWDFGDGSSSSQQNPTHSYIQKGTYSVTLTIVGNANQRDSTSRSVIVVSKSTLTEPKPSPGKGKTIEQALDTSGNGYLEDTEIKQATRYWIKGDIVPGSSEHITDTKMRELIQLWITNSPVAGSTVSPDAPKIAFAQSPDTVDIAVDWLLGYLDPNGDIKAIRFENLTPDGWVAAGEWDPGVEGRTRGTIVISLQCIRVGPVTARIILQDEKRHESEPFLFKYTCLSVGEAFLFPKITSVDIPRQINGTASWKLGFEDPEGDIVFVQFSVLRNGSWIDAGKFDPNTRGATKGFISITTVCKVFGASVSKVILVDRQGNFSNPFQFSYECTGVVSSTTSSAYHSLSNDLTNPQPILEIKAFVTSGNRLNIKILYPNLSSFEVQVFDLQGRKVFQAESKTASQTSFLLSDQQGRSLPNGVYFYIVTTKGFNGEIKRSKLKKLVVLR